jgi:hypothetical protein
VVIAGGLPEHPACEVSIGPAVLVYTPHAHSRRRQHLGEGRRARPHAGRALAVSEGEGVELEEQLQRVRVVQPAGDKNKKKSYFFYI